MKKNIRLESERMLAVEGNDECHFFNAMLRHEALQGVQIIDIGGKDKFKIELPLLMNLENFSKVHTIGFIRDAETNQASSAFSSICRILSVNNLPAPPAINSVYKDGALQIGIFIMPNNVDAGMLEDLCLESVRKEPIFECVEQFIDCCTQKSTKRIFNISKAKVQTFLAPQKPLANSLGIAAQKGYWDFEHCCFDEIKQFLHNLFMA